MATFLAGCVVGLQGLRRCHTVCHTGAAACFPPPFSFQPIRMTQSIHIKGAREHNLRNIELKIPRGQLVVVTGVSGSGKSSLAFDTLYAEGYRKYVESLSTHARALLEQVKRPEVDFIHGLSPVVAIEQRGSAGANPRSTVATVTEVADYARMLWAVCAEQFDPIDGAPIAQRSLDDCIATVMAEPEGSRLILLAHVMTAKAAALREELPRLRQKGFLRVRITPVASSLPAEPSLPAESSSPIEPTAEPATTPPAETDAEAPPAVTPANAAIATTAPTSAGEIHEIDAAERLPSLGKGELRLDVVIDRIVLRADQRARLADSLELAFAEGRERASVLAQSDRNAPWKTIPLSRALAGTRSGVVYEPLTPRNFSWNHAEGACPTCGGLGRSLQFNEELIVPDPSKTVRGGAIKPWRLGSKQMIIQRNAILKQLAEQLPFDPNLPWQELPQQTRDALLHGTGERLFTFKLKRGKQTTPAEPFAGVIADLEHSRANTSSDGLRARLLMFQVSSLCPDCRGSRLNARSRHALIEGIAFTDFMALPLTRAHQFVRDSLIGKPRYAPVAEAVSGLGQRLGFLCEVGLGYLQLDRGFATLSGGEAQRVRLATQLGMNLVGVCYVLDEPSIGLHPLDNEKLIHTLRGLCNGGNGVVVVEHDEAAIRAADHLIELGPGAGKLGGEIIFEGSPQAAATDPRSLTGAYLSGRRQLEREAKRKSPAKAKDAWLTVRGARHHNLKSIDASFPVGLLTVVSGVSGSGKSTLVNEILGNAAAFRLNGAKVLPGAHAGIDGLGNFSRLIRVDQEPIGKSPRSNPATYTKIFDLLRTLFAQCPLAKVRGYKPSRFSFNVRGGRCERCQGDGQIRLDMQFLGDVYVECPSCRGQRYNRETLEVRYKGKNIAEVLDMTVDEALQLFRSHPRLAERLQTLTDVGLGYIGLGQASNTLSGGEAQRIKLSLELSKRQQGDTLYLLDEPTTGLHWEDIQKLLNLLFSLRDAGNTVIIIEHHSELIALADWVLELGPEGGERGGQLLFSGTPEGLKQVENSPTGRYLK